jgi:RHS repeat-associated protein
VVEEIGYDSFGNSTGSSITRYTYTGREFDSDTQLYYYRARFYDPHIGRFVSEDSITSSNPDINLYPYVRNDPMRYVDPNGTNPLLALAAVVGGEVFLHYYLSDRASGLYLDDPYGRKKHCYVNCMSTRIHGFIPIWPTIASVEQETGGLALGILRGTFRDDLRDSAGDLAADFNGQAAAAVFWRSCQTLCANCQF